MSRLRALAALALLLAHPGRALDPFPTRSGESGLLDVPDAEVLDQGAGLLGVEAGFDHVPGTRNDFGPGPLSLGVGLGSNLEAGLAMREWSLPGDPRPTRLLFGAALKWRLVEASGARPAIAVDATADRFNWKATQGVRLIASTADVGRLRLAAFVGGEGHGPTPYALGVTAGVAASILHRSGLETVVDALTGPEGSKVGAALRWAVRRQVGLSIGADWLPEVHGFRVGVGLGILAPAPPSRAAPPPPPMAEQPAAPAPALPRYLDERPRFRLRIPVEEVPGGPVEPRHLQYGPAAAAPETGRKPLTTEQAREIRIAGLEKRLDVREERLAAAEQELGARGERQATENARLGAAEQELAARDRQLAARELRAPSTAPVTAGRSEAEARASRARAAEADPARRERQGRAAAAEAGVRENRARSREAPLREAVARQQAALARHKDSARRLDLRERISQARDRQLGAWEDRLAASRQRVELFDEVLAARRERLDALGRHLAAREDRLLALEAPRRAPEAPRPAAGDKPVVIVVVKPPTSILRSAPAAAGPGAPGARPALHRGVAVEKVVAGAAVVYFAAPGEPMRELDRQAVEGIARLAAGQKDAEVLVWARAQNPGLMGEAARRAEELKLLALEAGPLAATQVVTRITVHPAATGVDVVISALREPAEGGAAATAPGATAGGPAPLLEGETARRQVRDAVVQVRPAIEVCFGAEMQRQHLRSADTVLRLTVDRQGRVARIAVAQAPLAASALEECLGAAAQGWRFPAAATDYAVELPITVVETGSMP